MDVGYGTDWVAQGPARRRLMVSTGHHGERENRATYQAAFDDLLLKNRESPQELATPYAAGAQLSESGAAKRRTSRHPVAVHAGVLL